MKSIKKENRECPMCEVEGAMVHNPKTEYKIKTLEGKVFGDGWKCTACGRGGHFPDDVDPRKAAKE